MGSSGHDYSQVRVTDLTARFEDSQSACAALVHDFPMFGPALAEWRQIWSEAVAAFPDPLDALSREVADSGAVIHDPIGDLLCQLADSGDILTPLLRRISLTRNSS